ncbi:hypothetical protein L484_027057 [Morus notabilis]|uniref:Uncharacterized protein n=1 Tax=Morus notabilis TaxID=981085 RepID=W9S0W8_9ROSA|nr:hypothetical protein L484_027057 [Morus notabilis]
MGIAGPFHTAEEKRAAENVRRKPESIASIRSHHMDAKIVVLGLAMNRKIRSCSQIVGHMNMSFDTFTRAYCH